MVSVSNAFLKTMEAAAARYDVRTQHREEMAQRVASDGILAGDSPARVEQRLRRLGTNLAVAEAIAAAPISAAAVDEAVKSVAPQLSPLSRLGLERLLGRNDLIDVGFLERGYRASRAVGRITIRSSSGGFLGFGTGFLISSRLLLTNNHVLAALDEAANSYVEFDYQAGLDGRPLTAAAFRLLPAELFVTDEMLDFTLVAVEETNQAGDSLGRYGALRLVEQEGKVIVGELTNIVQHPNGEPKQLAMRENKLVDLLDLFLHYETDTAPGSSGSPVFNDQWEVLGLHHSGVPARDEDGAYVAIDGSRWTPSMGEGQVKWVANEAIRISKVLAALRTVPLTDTAAALLAAIAPVDPFIGGPGVGGSGGMTPPRRGGSAEPAGLTETVTAAGTSAHFTLPLRISVALSVDGTTPTAVAGATPSYSPPPAPPRVPPVGVGVVGAAADVDQKLLAESLAAFEANRSRPYYDEVADTAAATTYYRGVKSTTTGVKLLPILVELLTESHVRQPKYAPTKMVYPWVDLHPDRKLRSIYSGKTFEPQDIIREDARIEARRTRRLQQVMAGEAAVGPDTFLEELALLEAEMPFNCEHVVPQSWFGKLEPMRGDLHHLFTCESRCNSFRSNTPYFDFEEVEEAVRPDCGRSELGRFEPNAGKGAVARATLYFLLRYGGVIGDEDRELQTDRLPILLAWHEAEPVGEWERHRNAAIAEVQGNRNPLIDHPDWATKVPFSTAFG